MECIQAVCVCVYVYMSVMCIHVTYMCLTNVVVYLGTSLWWTVEGSKGDPFMTLKEMCFLSKTQRGTVKGKKLKMDELYSLQLKLQIMTQFFL